MAWTYDDYITYADTSTTRLSRLRLHIQEVSAELAKSKSYSADGRVVQKHDLIEYIKELREEEKRLTSYQNAAANTDSGGIKLCSVTLKGMN